MGGRAEAERAEAMEGGVTEAADEGEARAARERATEAEAMEVAATEAAD